MKLRRTCALLTRSKITSAIGLARLAAQQVKWKRNPLEEAWVEEVGE